MKPNQKHEKIKISELRLWSENPRDPIDANTDDLDIIKRAIEDDKRKWNLKKMMNEMGEYYDNSELPTVVYHENKPIVYDGNRRIAILKCLQNPDWHSKIESKLSLTQENENLKNMKEIVCNVCDKETALKNIERKHTNSGSWKELERDYFLHRHRGEEKSAFIKFEENTGIISSNTEMNQRFVKEETITPENLKEIGFGFKEDKLVSNYEENESKKILNNIVEMVKDKKINTRRNRGELKKSLEENFPDLKNILDSFKENDAKPINYEKEEPSNQEENSKDKETRRQNKTKIILFGEEPILLRKSFTNDAYQDIKELFGYWEKIKNKRPSKTFPNLIRMGLRLLVECANDEDEYTSDKTKIKEYVEKYFQEAKNKLSQDNKTTLANHSTSKAKDLIKLLHTGAHNYKSSSNIEQTIAMSLIIGEMLKISHGK